MFSFEMSGIANVLMAFSIGGLCGQLMQKTSGKGYSKKVMYANVIWFSISLLFLIWVLFNKELFRWKYDIATGEAVDHYSTYGKCIIRTSIALILNVAAAVIGFIKRRKQRTKGTYTFCPKVDK